MTMLGIVANHAVPVNTGFSSRCLCRAHPADEQRSAGSWRDAALQQAQQHQVPALLPPLPAQPGPAPPVLRERHQARAQPLLLSEAPG